MVHLNDLDEDAGSSPLYPRLPGHIYHELGEMGNKAKRRKRRFVSIFQRAADRLRKQLLREKCLHALKRRHFQHIKQHSGYKCFSEYEPDPSLSCHAYLKNKRAICQACVIVTKLMEVLNE